MIEWQLLEARPHIPPGLEQPDPTLLGLRWWEAELEDLRLVVTFTGEGRPPHSPYLAWVYTMPVRRSELTPEEGSVVGLAGPPTLEEVWAATGLVEDLEDGVEGVMFQMPPFLAGFEMPQTEQGTLLQLIQAGAVAGTPAAERAMMSLQAAQGGVLVGG